ncbi:hypothetical protein FOMPIDRAFT_87306 [Fomitopsis schrenkii]|uniref:Uncharacterized protein n=1 Tax=Fomitopsis schrenkii TaxID=2126942 RepID=S8F6Z9_FOMSC|nr:hypothetical protein FOMPIDRAFT_87306 [Fomitopsis schrenkii]
MPTPTQVVERIAVPVEQLGEHRRGSKPQDAAHRLHNHTPAHNVLPHHVSHHAHRYPAIDEEAFLLGSFVSFRAVDWPARWDGERTGKMSRAGRM